MGLMQQLLTRCQAQRLTDDDGNPTDTVQITLSRLDQFLKPFYKQQRVGDDHWRVRVEWLGRFKDGEGSDVFKLEAELCEQIAKEVADEAGKASIVKNYRPDEPLV